ncbi:MFS transporter, partial [Nonomuraea aridisoli]|uniref:MFS transporter n=1 Tax=Nonomuraea aridisoli TaxID=2070368 RepID=UPI0015E87FD1
MAAVTAPFALLADAVAYLVSAALLSRVRAAEPAREVRQGTLRAQVAEGLTFVAREPVLRRVAAGGALTRLAFGVCAVGYPLYLAVELRVDAALYGLLLSASAVGALGGAALADRLTRRYGVGPTLYGSALLTTALHLPAIATGPGWRLLIFPVASALAGVAATVFNVAQLSYRQRITPERMLGRVNASMRFLMWGATPLGGLAVAE